MFLKSIELFGFKSFPERTRIEFEDGIVAILGPNGCGKSNIVDAVKWVIGEQSSKTLRATKMGDVIFNGTESRKPLNVSEVILTLSNTNGILPLDRPEIAIKRRLYRSGESEYYINSELVRLKEIKELFFDTGIGKSAYSVMEQGEIDQILSNKPEERRYIFEEAAGITKFRIKSQDAEGKLAKTEENMRQIVVILAEVKKNYDTLQSQAVKTKIYRELKNKIFENDRDLQLLHLKKFILAKDKMEESLGVCRQEMLEIETVLERTNKLMEDGIDQVNKMESELIEIQKKLYGIDLERKNLGNQIKIHKERIEELEKKIRDNERQEQEALKKLTDFKGELDQRKEGLDKLVSETDEVESNILGFERDLNHFTEKISINNELILQNRNVMEIAEKKIEELTIDLREITDDIVTQLDQRLREIGYSHSERVQLEEEIDEVLLAIQIKIKGKSSIVEDLRKLSADKESGNGQILETLGVFLSEAVSGLNSLIALFAEYKKLMPSFIDEFLAPKGIITKKREIDLRISEAQNRIVARRKENEEFRQENYTLGQKIEEYRKTLENLRVNLARMETQKKSVREEIDRLSREVKDQQAFLDRNKEALENTQDNLKGTILRIKKLEDDLGRLEEEESRLKLNHVNLEKEIAAKNRSVMSKEKFLKKKADNNKKLRSRFEKLQIDSVEIKTEIRNLYQNFREKYSRNLEEFEDRIFEIKSPISTLKNQLNGHREEIKGLGHVNLMAPEEFEQLKERFEFLQSQLTDLQNAKKDLQRVTEEIKNESSQLFLDTYGKIKKNFHIMLRRLFGGGRAELRLLNPDNILDSGIAIYAQPPGKKLENIQLLSGGERSLTAVALLFATFMVKPAPFCILDEIDAALDEENIGRFINLLREFSNSTQFIIITHNKRTIVGSETLLGITMEESGVSKIITTRLREYEKRA